MDVNRGPWYVNRDRGMSLGDGAMSLWDLGV